MNIDLNKIVKVKLTNDGIKILKNHYDNITNHIQYRSGYIRDDFKLQLDKDGYYCCTLKELMYTFGKDLYPSNDTLFVDNSIIIED